MKRVFFAVLLAAVSISAFAQGPTNTGSTIITGYQYWPQYPPVGIGTEGYGGPVNAALQLHYDDPAYTKPALLRFSQGGATNTEASGVIALLPTLPGLSNPSWMHLTSLVGTETADMPFVIRANHGDLILTNNWKDTVTGAIRLATRPRTALLPPGTLDTDYERLTIMGNGNVGINLSPDGTLCRPEEQLQIGGSSTTPGLTMYGGNRFEGMPRPTGGGLMPVDARYLAFNYATDHYDTSSSRATRLAPLASSRILFDYTNGGVLEFECDPFDTSRGLKDFRRGVHMLMMGDKGIECWSDESDSNANHHLFDIWRPKFPGYNMNIGGDSLRNENGLFVHYTPVLISETSNWNVPNFTNLKNVHPSIGDGSTWMLAVNGSALFKEAFVSLKWPDYVFEPSYKLMPLPEVEEYIQANHHLPGVPSADDMKDGVPLGRTEAKLMEKIEELTKYAIEQNKRIDRLETELRNLKGGKQ